MCETRGGVHYINMLLLSDVRVSSLRCPQSETTSRYCFIQWRISESEVVNPNGGMGSVRCVREFTPLTPVSLYTLLSVKIGLLMLMKLYFLCPTFHKCSASLDKVGSSRIHIQIVDKIWLLGRVA